jgi:hypothetical protein
MPLNWNVSKEDHKAIMEIVDRAERECPDIMEV